MHLEELKDLIRQEIVSMKEAEKSDRCVNTSPVTIRIDRPSGR